MNPDVIDPVCGMALRSEAAVAQTAHEGGIYHFCSVRCHDEFERNPGAYARRQSAQGAGGRLDAGREEKPPTQTS